MASDRFLANGSEIIPSRRLSIALIIIRMGEAWARNKFDPAVRPWDFGD
jgi:hypothetical protein